MVPIENRAAKYVRMSTDMQRYSLENQADAIALYAARRELTIVRTYADAGRSGLRIDRRDALKQLIADVRSGHAGFSVILVYDVSRWGRFQDSDESAYYEFICKEAGVTIEYCAEQFTNDGSLTATVIKNIKRAMAAEYSRELSVKVHAGQSRIASLGFRRGGEAGYGLRRCLLDANGTRKGILESGERKNLTTDRVILVPGPASEVAVVRRIYRMFVNQRLTLRRIAARLNADKIPNAQGRAWLPGNVREILTNEKYIGTNVFNQTSARLGGKWRRNPRSIWVRAEGAFEAIVPRELFERARMHHRRRRMLTPNELLDSLTALWCRYGTISSKTLTDCSCAPGPHIYQRCFGGLKNACAQVGLVKPRVVNWTKNHALRNAMHREIVEGIRERGGDAEVLPRGYMLRLNEEMSLSTSVVRKIVKNGYTRWVLGYKTHQRPDILLVARMVGAPEAVNDYFCFPYLLFGRNWLTFADGAEERIRPFQVTSVSFILEAFSRAPIQKARELCRSADASPFESRVHWPTLSVEDSVTAIVNVVRHMMAERNFIELLYRGGLRSMPRMVTPEQLAYSAGSYGRSLIDFAVVWSFIVRILARPEVAAFVQSSWPSFTAELKMTYFSILTQGPLARVPPGLAFLDGLGRR